MKIYLIGLPGVGKTTVGKALASKIGYNFIDLDVYIEQQAMLFVDEIFHLYGEEYFRALETNCLIEVSNKDNIVISCGGGIVKNPKNKDYMDGPCVYLFTDLEEINKRLNASSIERPVLTSKTIGDLYLERKELYDSFKTIEVKNNLPEDCANEIMERLSLK